jgi:hypothetical protein
VGGLLLLGVLWWTLAWVARPGGGPGSVVAGLVIAGSVAHACFAPIWHAPLVALSLAALAGSASTPGGAALWRLRRPRGEHGPSQLGGTAGAGGGPAVNGVGQVTGEDGGAGRGAPNRG